MARPPKIRSREVVGRAGKVNSSSTPGTASRSNRRATAPTTLSAGVLLLISRARSRRACSSSGVRLMSYSIGLRRGAPLFEAFYLFAVEFDRGGAADDRHRHLVSRLFAMELLNPPVEACDRPGRHLALLSLFIL